MSHFYLSFALCFLSFLGTQVSAKVSAPTFTDCSDLKATNPECIHGCDAVDGEFECNVQIDAKHCQKERYTKMSLIKLLNSYPACTPE